MIPSVHDRKHKRRHLWQHAAHYDTEVVEWSPYIRDGLKARPATLTYRIQEPQFKYLKTQRQDSDDSSDDDLQYAYAKLSWQEMLKGPQICSAIQMQKLIRGKQTWRRYQLLLKAKVRWLHTRIAKAFTQWLHTTHFIARASRILKVAFTRMQKAALARAWRTWYQSTQRLKQQGFVKRKVLLRLGRTKWLHAAWHSWLLYLKWILHLSKILDSAFRRWAFRSFGRAFQTWCRNTRHAAQVALLSTIVRRILYATLSQGFRAWLSTARTISLLSNTFFRAILHWMRGPMARAFRRLKSSNCQLLGASGVRPPMYSLNGVEERLKKIELLAKQLRLTRLQDDLGHARAVSRLASSGWQSHCPCVSYGTSTITVAPPTTVTAPKDATFPPPRLRWKRTPRRQYG